MQAQVLYIELIYNLVLYQLLAKGLLSVYFPTVNRVDIINSEITNKHLQQRQFLWNNNVKGETST